MNALKNCCDANELEFDPRAEDGKKFGEPGGMSGTSPALTRKNTRLGDHWALSCCADAATGGAAVSSMVSMSVRVLSHSRSMSPLEAKKRRILAESQRRTSSSTGMRTLMALSLSTVRRAARVMNLASETAMV